MCLVGHYVLSCRYKLTSSVNTSAWIRATANSRIVNRMRIVNVIKAVIVLMLSSANVAPPIR